VFEALLVDEDPGTGATVREALADVGCVDIETVTFDASALDGIRQELVVVMIEAGRVGHLKRLVGTDRAIVAICQDEDVDAALLAGAAECVALPIRPGELRARIRAALRGRAAAHERARSERRMSDAIVALTQEKHDLERLACVDALTGVANRRHTLAVLGAEWRRSMREHNPLAVIMIDLDCYHAYNEQYGHLGGDQCLRRISEAMVACLRRPSDYLGRYGGEEFLAVLPNTDAVGAKIVAERLRASVELLAIPHAASVCGTVVTITAGFASLRAAADLTVDRLIAVADQALLRAKANGRNRIEGDAPLVRSSRVSAQRWQRYEPVLADPWFVDRIPAFLSRMHSYTVGLLRVIGALEIAATTSMLASMRASASEYLLDALEQLLAELERSVASARIADIRVAAEQVVQYVTHVQIIYRRAA